MVFWATDDDAFAFVPCPMTALLLQGLRTLGLSAADAPDDTARPVKKGTCGEVGQQGGIVWQRVCHARHRNSHQGSRILSRYLVVSWPHWARTGS